MKVFGRMAILRVEHIEERVPKLLLEVVEVWETPYHLQAHALIELNRWVIVGDHMDPNRL